MNATQDTLQRSSNLLDRFSVHSPPRLAFRVKKISHFKSTIRQNNKSLRSLAQERHNPRGDLLKMVS